MKIVRIIARLNIGGPAIHVVLLTRGFEKRGDESHLLVGPVPESEGDMEYYAAEHQVKLTRIPELVRPVSPWKDLVALWKIYRFIRQERPDVVHTHTSKAGTLGRLAALLAATPAIFHTFHGSVFDGYFSPLKTRLFLAVERVLARFTSRVITVSSSLKKELSEIYRIAPPDKIEVVPLGFDLSGFAAIAGGAERQMSTGRVPVIGWVGRFTEIKDPLLFVECAAAMKAGGIAAKFVMVGDGSLRGRVEQAVSESGLTADLSLLGWQRDMPRIYSRIDVLLSTSVNEGTPVTIIEAMATGCPFVAPNVGGLTDLAGDVQQREGSLTICTNGILVDRRNTETLRYAVSLLLAAPERRARMGAAGHRLAVDSFGQERLVRQTALLYDTFLEHRAKVTQRSAGESGDRKLGEQTPTARTSGLQIAKSKPATESIRETIAFPRNTHSR
jgi:glycosyltransferase involved in cell wall biosynthesis